MARHRIPDDFVPLYVKYFHDEDLRRAGPDAELLYIRGMAYSRDMGNGGRIPDVDFDSVAVGHPRAAEGLARLVEHGLWLEVEGGWQIRSWAKWNGDDEAADERRQKAAERQRRRRERQRAAANGEDVTRDSGEQGRDSGVTAGVTAANTPVTGHVTHQRDTSVTGSVTPQRDTGRYTGSDTETRRSQAQNSTDNTRTQAVTESVTPGVTPQRDTGRDEAPKSKSQSQKKRVPTTSGAEAPPPDGTITPQTIVAAWVDAMKANNVVPTGSMRGQAGKVVKELLDGGNDPELVLEAAKAAGAKGYATIDREIGPLAKARHRDPVSHMPPSMRWMRQA